MYPALGSLAPPLPIALASSSPPFSDKQKQDNLDDDTLQLRPPRRRQRWQWSKGDGPGEYGGPPLDYRLRRMWGSQVEDPLVSTDDYIWKKDWQKHVESPPSDERPMPKPLEKHAEVGFLSLNRSISLNSIDVDLSKEFTKPSKSLLSMQVEATRQGLPNDEAIKQEKPKWRMAPTRREQKQWERARKAGAGDMAVLISEAGDDRRDPKVVAAQSKEQYKLLKINMQLLTLALGGIGAASAYLSYSPEVAASYGVGVFGSLAYIRMLGNSVESLGKQDAKGALRGAVGQPRLLVPVVLVMLYNRWNELLVPEYGFIHLQLIPILVGFFTYKVATITEVFKQLLSIENEEY